MSSTSNDLMSCTAKCCKPMDEPLKYFSVTVFQNCSPEIPSDFYVDNDYRKQWDMTVVEHKQPEVDKTMGNEIGRTIKKFPLLTPREHVLAWRLWEGKEKTCCCFIKFLVGMHVRSKCITKKTLELNVEKEKLAFSRGIWSYLCKMDNALGSIMQSATLIWAQLFMHCLLSRRGRAKTLEQDTQLQNAQNLHPNYTALECGDARVVEWSKQKSEQCLVQWATPQLHAVVCWQIWILRCVMGITYGMAMNPVWHYGHPIVYWGITSAYLSLGRLFGIVSCILTSRIKPHWP